MKPDAPVTTRIMFFWLLATGYWLLLPSDRVVVFAVPGDGLLHAAFERHGRPVAEQRHRLLNRRHAQLHFRTRVRLEHDLGLRIGQAEDEIGQLEIGRRALRVADVERVADRGPVFAAAQHAVDEVGHEAPRADLRAVVVEGDGQVLERLQRHAADGAVADLPWAIDVERPHDRQRQVVLAVMGVGQVLGGELAGGIHPPALADRPDRGEVVFLALMDECAVDLARRELDEALDAGLDRRLYDLVRAEQVDLHGPDRAAIDGIDAGDRRAVDHDRAAVNRLADGLEVEHVALDERQVLVPLEVGELQRVAMQVVEHHHVVVVDELRHEVRADEPGAAGDENTLIGQGHESERLTRAFRWWNVNELLRSASVYPPSL